MKGGMQRRLRGDRADEGVSRQGQVVARFLLSQAKGV